MSNKLFNKSISIFLTMIFIIGLFPSVAFAQPLPSSQYGEVKGFNRSVLDSHFSKADREINPERWLAEAKLGLTQAINAWELIANNLYENPDLFEEAKTALEKWSNEELEKRFSQWLNSRFFGEAAEKILLDFSQAFGETHKNYSWHLDADGNIIFDVKTGNPLIIRPNEEGREFSHDLLLWRDDAESHVNNVMIRLFPELLAYIPEELRETMASIINQTAMSKSNAIKMEFENIAAREERIFTSRRTRDLWSLRNKSENEAARIFTERLIAETDEVCKAGIEALNSRIEQAEAGASDLAIMGEEWLRLYKEQFERGLKAWEEAEERFFIRRIEWEQESFKLFSEGEETWLSAFNQLEEERQKWELKAKELFQAGEIMFKNISDDFNKSIADARKEFELNMSMRIGEGTTRVKALIDMYLICASAALSSMENVNFWFNQYDVPNKVNPKDLNFSVWLDNEQKKGSNNLLIEMKKSHDMYSSYIEKALDARDRILEDYAELLGTGALKDILSPEASSEDFFLDEYQIALIRAKALVLYWERKTEIAEAVTVYATELTAGRMTEAEGLRAWEEAKAAYNDSLFAYEAELKKLNEFGEDIKEQQEKLYLLTQNLQKEEEKLNRLNKDYTILISNSVISQSNYYLLDFKAKYIDLKDEYKKFQKTGTDANYKATLEYGMLWGIAEQKEAEKKYLNMLENIEDLSEEEIEFLQLAYNSITSFNQEENIQAVRLSLNTLFGNYGINQGNNFLPNIQNIIQAITAKPGDIESNMFQFINEFNECLSMIPFWLELEINNWVTSIVQYINIYTQNFTENEKHWRQYLSGELINDNDPEFVLVSSVKEGKLADALFIATYYTNRVNDSFAMFSNINRYNVTENTSLYFLLYYDGFSGIEFNINTLEYQYNEIINKARAYELSKLSTEDSIRQLSILEQSINLQNAVYNSLINEYYFEADKFINLGSVYDRQYNVLKKAHENSDQKRFEYEKQDAIQRWASTSYLNIDINDPVNCKTKLLRAQTVLNVLSDLYNNESKRSYNDPEYNKLYSEYEQSFARRLKVLEVVDTVLSITTQEYANNKILYEEYQNALNQLGNYYYDYSEYTLPSHQKGWGINDILTIKDGRIAFSKDNSFTLTGIDESIARNFEEYFASAYNPDNKQFEASLYEKAITELNQRMSGYLSNPKKLEQWSFARDYLITSLINANEDLKFLNNFYFGIGDMKEGGTLGSLRVKTGIDFLTTTNKPLYSALLDEGIIVNSDLLFEKAWAVLTDEERADLEFYVILTLLNMENEYYAGFAKMYTADIYGKAGNFVNEKYIHAVKALENWLVYPSFNFIAYEEMRDINERAINLIKPVYREILMQTREWEQKLGSNLTLINNAAAAFLESSNKISALEGIKQNGQNINWADINLALLNTENINKDDISKVRTYWESMQENSNNRFSSISEALITLYHWTKNEEEKSKNALDTYWIVSTQRQQLNEYNFQTAVNDYIAGNINRETLVTAAQNAYGKNSISGKNHLDNLHSVMLNNLSLYMNIESDFFTEFSILGEEIVLLTKQTIENRYMAELNAREAEWYQMFMDISEKYFEWQNTASQIFENGRTDWITSQQKMEDAYKQWFINFQNEYERVNNEWAEMYLAGLEDKEEWLEQAANAANNASSGALLSLVGTEGERLSRFMNTREPLGIRNAIPETQTLMSNLLQSSGIVNMSNAFGSLNNISSASSTLVRSGMGGISIWDTALVRTAANDLARRTNAEIADGETRKLAYNVQLTADEAVRGLYENVNMANENFRKNIDNIFIFNGLWRRSGENYVKDITKGSTLFTPVISETVTVTGYANYIIEPVKLKTNMDEKFLASLDSIAIQNLIENINEEIIVILKEIFGINQDPKTIDEERAQSAGKFGAHIGHSPSVKPSEEISKKREDVFHDEGEGELGRLMAEFIYWSVIDNIGSAELSLAPWDKRMWDDEGSWFKAPNLRTVGSIACSVAAGFVTGGAGWVGIAVSVGVGSASEILFGALDVTGGYKDLGEVAVNVGKSVLTSAVGQFGGGLFGGVKDGFTGLTNIAMGQTSNAVGKVITKTMMTGLQTITTGIASSLISGITYNSEEGFGYSNEIVNAGLKNVLNSAATSMTSTLVSTSMTAINSGIDMSKLEGFNKINQGDLQNFNNLLGSLAGQGVDFALGNNFTLNLFNLGFIPGVNNNVGMLELNIGRDGTKMNFGTGGANVSINNLVSSFKGVLVWDTNTQINNYVKDNKNKFDAAIALRAQYGYGDKMQKNQLRDILKGDVVINTDAEGKYTAKTTRDEDGKRVINLANYETGMSAEEQMRLAVILGHEAYRDGYKPGEQDASGNTVTKESNFIELKEASIARLAMGDRIQEEHNWFYSYNLDFDLENYFLLNAKETGDYSLYDEYLHFTFNNDEDFFFPATSTRNNFQNEDRYRNIPLLNASSQERVDEINRERLQAAYGRYLSSFSEEGRNTALSMSDFEKDNVLLKENDYIAMNFISLYDYGCRFMSAKYILESLKSRPFNALDLHEYAKRNNLFSSSTLLSSQDIANIITFNTNGTHVITIVNTPRIPSVEQLYQMQISHDKYYACLKVPNGIGGDHFVTLSEIIFTFDNTNNPIGISEIRVANPWNSSGNLGRTTYTYAEIKNWDIFLATQRPLHYRSFDLQLQ